MNGLALCAGAGGLELGLRLALGDAYRTVGYVERDAYAAACLVARMEDEALDRAPVWDDLTTFDGGPWRGRVDLVSAGFPCQPSSSAGRRRGTDDERWLWPDIARVVRAVDPRLAFIENVRGLLTVNGGAAFGEVVETLADLGFDAEWDLFSAAEVGAPHLRERLFLLAYRHGDGRPLLGGEQLSDHGQARCWDDADGCGGAELADADPERLRQHDASEPLGLTGRGGATHPCWSGGTLADAGSGGRREGAGAVPPREPVSGPGNGALGNSDRIRRGQADEPRRRYAGNGQPDGSSALVAHAASAEPLFRRPVADAPRSRASVPGPPGPSRDVGDSPDGQLQETRRRPEGRGGPFPPGPGDQRAWAAILDERPDLAPAVESAVRGVADGMAHRVDRLRTAGNGVVPLVAAVAFLALAARVMEAAP